MTTLRRRLAVVVALFAALLALPSLTNSAGAYPPGAVAGVTISASGLAQGCSLTISGTNFFGTVTFTEGSTNLGTVTAASDGSFSKNVPITAATFSQGSHTVSVSDAVGDHADVTFTVTAPGTGCNNGGGTGSGSGSGSGSGGLSNTGVAVLGIGAVGLVLVAGGGLMLLAGRRRKAVI